MQQDHQVSSPQHSGSGLSKIAFRTLLVTTILAPLAFWPTQYVALDLIKVLVIAIGTITSAILIIISVRKDGKIIFLPKQILWAGILLTISIIISALLSSHIDKSFFGQGFEFGTASSLLVLFVAGIVSYITISHRLQRAIVLYIGIMSAYVLLFLFQAIRLSVLSKYLTLSFLRDSTSTILGSWSSLGTYSLLVVIIAILANSFLTLSRRAKFIYWLMTILGFVGALIAYNKSAWQAAIIVFLGLNILIYLNKLAKNHKGSTSVTKRISWLCVVALLVSIGLFWKGESLSTPITNYLKVSYSEVSLSWRATLDIASEVIKEDALFGVGPNRFAQAYANHKPLAINLTSVWNAEFAFGFGVLSTLIVTQGIVGSILWLIFITIFILLAIRTFRNLPSESHQRFILISLFSSSIFLWIIMSLSIPSQAIIFFTFVLTGASIGAAVFCGIIKPTEISISTSSRGIGKIIYFIPHALIVICLLWALIYIKKTTALIYFGSGIKELTLYQNPDSAGIAFSRALQIDSSDIYWRAKAEALISKVNILIQEFSDKPSVSVSEEKVLQVTGTINDALFAARKAIDYDPLNYYNHISEARVFEVATGLKMDGAVDATVQAYLRAIGLVPNNPALYISLARFQASQNRLDDALQSVGAAIKVKQNYPEAIFMLSQIQAGKGNIKDAIIAAKVATEINPSDPLLAFHLGLLYYTDKQYSLAVGALSNAIELEPSYANAQYFLGLAYYYQNKRAEAIEQFMKITISNPQSQEASLILANLKAGKSPFANTNPPITSEPEKRTSLPLKDDSL